MENSQSLLDMPQRKVTEAQYLDSLAALMKRHNEVGITSILWFCKDGDALLKALGPRFWCPTRACHDPSSSTRAHGVREPARAWQRPGV